MIEGEANKNLDQLEANDHRLEERVINKSKPDSKDETEVRS